jgi:predicted GNAT superfamily acetyltransferase
MSVEITIRRAETIADYLACQSAQRRAWSLNDQSYVVPVATMVGAQLHGGLVLGAFLPSGEAVGVSFAFLGRVEGRLCLYSQLTGVVPEYQDQGIGRRLKFAQRDFARSEGLAAIAWAFDPLQSGNAYFNLGKLGAAARRYIENMYGPRTDPLNAGQPTDRLIAEWATVERPRPALEPEIISEWPRLITTIERPDGLLAPDGLNVPPAAPRLLLEIPGHINRLRDHEPALAEAWRLAVRQAFRAAFAAGYEAVGFLREDSEERRRCYYRLQRQGERAVDGAD